MNIPNIVQNVPENIPECTTLTTNRVNFDHKRSRTKGRGGHGGHGRKEGTGGDARGERKEGEKVSEKREE